MNVQRMRSLLWCIVLGVAGCRGGGRIQGAVYAGEVPVYPGAVFTTTSHGSYTDSAGRPPSLESQSWFFKIQDSIAKVADYYQKQLPAAHRDDDEDGITFTFVPQGADRGETVSITIRKGELQIGETTKPRKRKTAV